ncbi:TonB-dependent receptor [Cellvibrio japonicus]|uniref:TonB-dependent receptor n=1 Tax=Cellvibrio japonicus (strain Ueda107) TaxID=498211 RepID=B3PEK2_CELJU|nr:TonB-dependent receptor [Cellvibrio japonicus]ACE83587.1 TonB-dependent receptor [Cellvibrio japonicus Ueda107]QEI13558.1 TonB-dependent receptor [Cellvibrio japonicus]QEI17132.1 TonB-dependent receptor [Cellvibrio japonicus]QEI20709.1 TonB-dependent receptor [Cellvibrio japonicus]
MNAFPKKFPTPLALAIALLNAGLATTAYAQNNSSERQAGMLEEVIVTATKRETNLMETPIAITVFGEETLVREGIANVKDMAKLVPNMDIAIDSSQTAPVITMRGVRSTNITELGDPAVGLHLDGIYSPRPQGAMALMFDVERVEAQRGPQGTLFGRNSTVGNVNIISKRPNMEEFDASLGLELGRWNHQQLRGMVNIPVSETFALRGSFMTEQRDSYLKGYYDPNQWDTRYLPDEVRNAPLYEGPAEERTLIQRRRWWEGGGDGIQQIVKADASDFYNNADQYAFRVAGLWEPGDSLSWMLAYERFQDSSAGGTDTLDCSKAKKRVFMENDEPAPLQGCEYAYGPGADEYTVLVSVPGMLDLSIENIRSNLRWDLSDDLAFVYNAGWAKQTRTQMSDQDRGITDWDMSIFFRDAAFKSQSHELQLQSTGDGRLQWITGLFFFKENNDMQGGWMNSMASASYWNQPDRTLSSEAIFAQGTYELTDDLTLTLGFRHTRDTKEDVGGHNMDCNDANPNQLDPTLNDGKCFPAWDRAAYNNLPRDYFWNPDIYVVSSNNDIKGKWDYNNYRLGLDYDISDDTMVFAYVANGTKAGGIGDVVVQYEQDPLTTEYPVDDNGDRIVKQRHENTYDPEEVVTWELGVKSDLFNNSLRLSATVFYSDYSDMQIAVARPLFVTYAFERDPQTGELTGEIEQNPFTVFQTDNVGEAEIKGVEIEFDWAVSENGRLSGYVTWLKTKIVSDFIQQWNYATVDLYEIDHGDSVNPENTLLTTNLKGNELPASPEFSINLNYSYNLMLRDGSSILPWIGVNWRDESYYSIFNVDKHLDRFASDTPEAFYDTRAAVTNVNLGVKYTAPDEQWSLEAFVNNATNEIDFYWGGSGDGYIKGPVSMPRFYGVRANYNF